MAPVPPSSLRCSRSDCARIASGCENASTSAQTAPPRVAPTTWRRNAATVKQRARVHPIAAIVELAFRSCDSRPVRYRFDAHSAHLMSRAAVVFSRCVGRTGSSLASRLSLCQRSYSIVRYRADLRPFASSSLAVFGNPYSGFQSRPEFTRTQYLRFPCSYTRKQSVSRV